MTIDADALPIDPAARAFFEARGERRRSIEALTGGDDYELLFTRPAARRAAVSRRRRATAACR